MVSQKEENMLSNQWANLALRNQNDSGLGQGLATCSAAG
jgi:hypothetical protein